MATEASASAEHPRGQHSNELSSRRIRIIAALSIFVGLLLCQNAALTLPNAVPVTSSNEAPKLTSESATTTYANCSSTMGQHIPEPRKELVNGLLMNPRAHVFSFPTKVRNSEGQRPLLCVPQKNGNKQFGGFVFAAWNNKPAISGEGVDRDMKHWEKHYLAPSSRLGQESHVYFVARNPYTRILSMYLQKVVNACISDGQKGCNTHGWHGIKPTTSFAGFVEEILEKLARHKTSLWNQPSFMPTSGIMLHYNSTFSRGHCDTSRGDELLVSLFCKTNWSQVCSTQ